MKVQNLHIEIDYTNRCCSQTEICSRWIYFRVYALKDADGIVISVDSYPTVLLGTFCSGSILFVQAYMSLVLRKPVFGLSNQV